MLFNSLHFVLFFIIVYSLYRALGFRWQNRLLLAASYYFYGVWDWRFLSLLLLSTAIDFLCALEIHKSTSEARRRLFIWLSVGSNLTVLGFFKYYSFFADSLQALAANLGVTLDDITLNIILPMGISFYTFQTMSYTIDVYRRRLAPCQNIWDFALYISFFPQLVAGPIERALQLLPQLTNPRRISREQIADGLWLIFFGFFLKVFVADNLSKVVDVGFTTSAPVSGDIALISTYAFAFQIFGDFAGYSSIAIGLGKLMGFELMTNFRFPYLVTNPSDFWRNWHISLSSWLRDYLYIPLGGNRGSRFMHYRNLFLTMLLGGLWHGAAWTFVIWGAYQGGVLILHRMLEPYLAKLRPASQSGTFAWWLIRVVFMFHITCIGWLIFRAQSAAQIGDMLAAIFTMPGFSPTAWYYASQVAFYSGLLILVQVIQLRRNDLLAVIRLPMAPRVALLAAMFFLAAAFGEYGGQSFIYFQF